MWCSRTATRSRSRHEGAPPQDRAAIAGAAPNPSPQQRRGQVKATSVTARPDGLSSRHVLVELQDSLGSPPPEVETPTTRDRLLTVDEAASFVGCHTNTIYLAASSGELPCHRVGRLRRFTREG